MLAFLLRCLLAGPKILYQTFLFLWHYKTRLDFLTARFGVGEDTKEFNLFGLPLVHVTRSPEVVQLALGDKFESFEKGPIFHASFSPLLGDGIFNTDGNQWKFQRKIASQIFSSRSLRDHMTVCFSRHSHHLLANLEAERSRGAAGKGVGAGGKYFDMQDKFYRFTFDSIGEIAFGAAMNCLQSDTVPFAEAFDYLQEYAQFQLTSPFSWLERNIGAVPVVGKLLFPKCSVAQKKLVLLNGFAADIVSKRLVDPSCGSKNDLLSQFITYSQQGMEHSASITPGFLRDVITNFIIAGRDTTAVAMSWCVHLISTHPDVQAKLLEEVDTVLQGNAIDYNTANNMPYLRAVIHEALRLSPPVPVDLKQCVETTALPGGKVIKKGQILIYGIYAMGRDKSRWGADAEQFKPERFLGARKRTAFEYPVFNAGPRLCLGQVMALLEATMCLATLYQNYTFVSDPTQKVTYGVTVTLPVCDGLRVAAVPRVRA